MERGNESDFEEDTLSDSSRERNMQSKKPHKGGNIITEEPINMSELLACPLATTCFIYQSCFEFCEMVERVKFHHELARQFVINMDNNVVCLAGVNFTLSRTIIAKATGISDVGEKWNKRQNISRHHYEPYIKAKYRGKLSRVFPFRFLEDRYVPLMKLIIKYFTCDGSFSRLYAYHVIFLMHFTRVKMISIPYFICKNIERMRVIANRKPYPQQLNRNYHFSVIKIIVLHQLTQFGMPWETFIAHECFKGSQIFLDPQEEGEPSGQQKELENKTKEVLVFFTYEIGTRKLFAAAR